MRLSEIMTSPVETIRGDETATAAWNKMQSKRIHHLVVTEGRSIIGVLSNSDLGGKQGQTGRSNRIVADLMSAPVVTADARMTVRDAANKLRGSVIGCLPVTERDRLIGIVTVSDLLDLIGKGVERPVAQSKRYQLHARGPRRRKPPSHLKKN